MYSAALWLLYVGDVGHPGKASALPGVTSHPSATLENSFKCPFHSAPHSSSSSSSSFTLVVRWEEILELHVLWGKSQPQAPSFPSLLLFPDVTAVSIRASSTPHPLQPLSFLPLPLALLSHLPCSLPLLSGLGSHL